jgi:hypothetical protein
MLLFGHRIWGIGRALPQASRRSPADAAVVCRFSGLRCKHQRILAELLDAVSLLALPPHLRVAKVAIEVLWLATGQDMIWTVWNEYLGGTSEAWN